MIHPGGFGSTKPSGACDPAPKKYFSISPTRNWRAFGSKGTRRYSLISIVWWPSHCCHASFDTLSKMRWPSSPGYGGRARPSASRPSFTQFTIRAILQLLEQSCHGRGQSDGIQRREFVPAGFALPDFAARSVKIDRPRLDGEVEMGESVPDRRKLAYPLRGAES